MLEVDQVDVNQEDDDIILRPDTLACLQEFLAAKAEQEEQEAVLLNRGQTGNVEEVSFSVFEEDWQLSQFWYNDKTKQILSGVCKKLVCSGGDLKIALLSCPSLYDHIRKVNADNIVRLFEFDKRFSCYGQDFVFYDYKDVTIYPEYQQYFDIVLMDPPFLSEECIEKLADIVKRISKPTSKIILCSGEVVEDWAHKYLGLRKCRFQPEHERNLGNIFASYANFQLDDLIT